MKIKAKIVNSNREYMIRMTYISLESLEKDKGENKKLLTISNSEKKDCKSA